jgi:hypothetical protein
LLLLFQPINQRQVSKMSAAMYLSLSICLFLNVVEPN